MEKKGSAILEILLAMGLMVILLPALLTGLYTARSGQAQQNQRVQAVALLNETEEAVRSIRSRSWNSFAVIPEGVVYHPVAVPSPINLAWTMVAGAGTVNGLTQSVVITSVNRNPTGAIVPTPTGTVDPSTKQVTITISWSTPLANSVTSTLYLSRYLDNTLYLQTLKTDFDQDSLNNTVSQNTGGGPDGEVVLGPNPHAKWCSPTLSSQSIDLPDGPPVAVAARANATDITIPNDVLVAVAPTPGTSTKLAYINVPANQDPPVPSLRGIFTLDPAKYSLPTLVPTPAVIGLDNTFRTNDVKYYTSASGKLYALLATTKPDREVVAILVNDNNDASSSEYQDPTNKIFKYWTYFNTARYGMPTPIPTSTPTPTPTPIPTAIPTSTPTPTPTPAVYDSGALNPSANLVDTGGDADGYQTTPTNTYTSNSTFAVDTNSGTNTNLNCADVGKDRHRFYNYGFAVPVGSTIKGVEVRLDAKVDSIASSTSQICAQVSWDGGTTWTATKTTAALTTANTTYTLGNATDTWGRTWSDTNFSNANFRLRLIDISNNNSRDFSLDWASARVYYNGFTPTNTPVPTLTPTPTSTPTPIPTNTPTPTPTPINDQAPFDYGAKSITVLGNTGYTISGGYLYSFDLSNIDSKSYTNGLNEIGCRIELDGYDCKPNINPTPGDQKYTAGQSGAAWSNTANPAHNDCSDGGNIELFGDNDISAVNVAGSNYVYVAVGAGTNPEFEIVAASSIPNNSSVPAINNNSCGTIASGNAGWKRLGTAAAGFPGTIDFNNAGNTEEAANSVFAKADGTRAYVSSNGGIDANGDGQPDSKQFYIIDTTNKSVPIFLGTNATPTPKFGFYYGAAITPTPSGAILRNDHLFPRRSMTVLNGKRAVLVGKDGITPTPGVSGPQEYQVLNIDANIINPVAPTPGSSFEKYPTYCGGVDFDSGFNDLTSVTEADTDTFVYMVANTPDKQLKIIEGGPDTTYSASGTVDSKTYDLGQNTTVNRFSATTLTSPGKTITIQLAVVPAGISGGCNDANFSDPNAFVGPDGTTGTSYTGATARVFVGSNGVYTNPGRCLRYRATFNTDDSVNSPTLQDVTINYSP